MAMSDDADFRSWVMATLSEVEDFPSWLPAREERTSSDPQDAAEADGG